MLLLALRRMTPRCCCCFVRDDDVAAAPRPPAEDVKVTRPARLLLLLLLVTGVLPGLFGLLVCGGDHLLGEVDEELLHAEVQLGGGVEVVRADGFGVAEG